MSHGTTLAKTEKHLFSSLLKTPLIKQGNMEQVTMIIWYYNESYLHKSWVAPRALMHLKQLIKEIMSAY